MDKTSIIQGGLVNDERGQIRFVNDFDMSAVKRFYLIKNSDTELIRGWRGHRIEQRWFYVISGSFSIDLIRINNWELPDPELAVEKKVLKSSEMRLLHVPPGYCTAFRALDTYSELLVYADYAISHALLDDYSWPLSYFKNSNFV